jgi:hypothetical protein
MYDYPQRTRPPPLARTPPLALPPLPLARPPPRGMARCFGGAGRLNVVAHFGICLAAVSGANRRVQCLQ